MFIEYSLLFVRWLLYRTCPLKTGPCPIMEPSTSRSHFYLLTLQRSPGSACTGFPSAPSRACPWSPGVCRSRRSRRPLRARRPRRSLPPRRWAELWSCCRLTLGSGRVVALVNGLADRVSTQKRVKDKRRRFKSGWELLTRREFHYGSHTERGAGDSGAQDPV